MFAKILEKIKEKIKNQQYVMTLHAEEEMEADQLFIVDLEQAIFTGQILERQRDPITAESKYRLCGDATDEIKVEVIVKLSPIGKVVIITVYSL